MTANVRGSGFIPYKDKVNVRHRLWTVLLAAAMTILLTACSMGASSIGTTGSAGETIPADVEDESADQGTVELRFWHYFGDDADSETLRNTVAAFNKAHEGSIHVTATYMSREELANQYTIGAVSGDLPDIGQVDSPDMASYIALGMFEDITEEVQAWGELDQYYEASVVSCMGTDNKIYGLPHNSNCLALLVNMDLLRAAGIKEAPTNVDAFAEAVAATTDKRTQTYGFAMSVGSTEEGTFQILPWLMSIRNGESTTIADLTADSAVAGLQMLGEFAANGYMSKQATSWGQADAYSQFVNGKVAICEIGSWHLANIDKEIGDTFDYQVVPLPTGDVGTSTSTLGGEIIGVCAGTQHKAEAVTFVEYMCSAQAQEDWVAVAGKLPTRRDVTPAYTHDAEWFAVFQEEMHCAIVRGPHPEWPTISRAIYTAAQNVLVNGIPAVDALEAANETIAPILAVYPLPES